MTGRPRTFGVGPGQRLRFSVLTKRSAASGDENDARHKRLLLYVACVKCELVKMYCLYGKLTSYITGSLFFLVL